MAFANLLVLPGSTGNARHACQYRKTLFSAPLGTIYVLQSAEDRLGAFMLQEWHLGSRHLQAPVQTIAHRVKA